MSEQNVKNQSERSATRADFYFAVFFFLVTVTLLSQLGNQTTWFEGSRVISQPRFWPAIGIFGMTLFSGVYLLTTIVSVRHKDDAEVVFWAKSLEYALWFMAYVYAVPIIGYLFTTLIFVYALSFRAGYRERTILIMAGVMGVFIVVVFKGFLSVKIPGGQLYEIFPEALRNFMILYM